jgi:hypothetical protein
MKKLLFTASILLNLVWLMAADFKPLPVEEAQSVKKTEKPACGYTIIEFGKGIDCHGDTIKLVKVNGMQVRAAV